MRRLTLPDPGETHLSRSELLIQAKGLLLCTLPLKRTAARTLQRRARIGKTDEILVTFAAVNPAVSLPFGADRALLAWIQTRAFRDGYILFDSLKDFFQCFRLNSSGANYCRFKERLERIANLTIQVRVSGSAIDITNAPPIERTVFPESPPEGRQMRVAGPGGKERIVRPGRYGLVLSRSFHRYLRESHIPLPLELLRRFHDKPMAWDFASLVIWRCYAASRPSVIPWGSLVEHLGSCDRDRKQLKRSLGRILASVRVAYPGFPVRFLAGYEGLVIEPWRLPGR
ncbi:MAG: hypothetical protein GY719_06190 [bacterium]|nr:hypothetical protein [bacterium]